MGMAEGRIDETYNDPGDECWIRVKVEFQVVLVLNLGPRSGDMCGRQVWLVALNLGRRLRWMISSFDLATVVQVKEPRLRIEWVTWWVPAPLLTVVRKKEFLCLPEIERRSTGSSCRGLVTMLTELFRQVPAYTLCVFIEEVCEL